MRANASPNSSPAVTGMDIGLICITNVACMHVFSIMQCLQAQKVGMANTHPLDTSAVSLQRCILQHSDCVQAVWSADFALKMGDWRLYNAVAVAHPTGLPALSAGVLFGSAAALQYAVKQGRDTKSADLVQLPAQKLELIGQTDKMAQHIDTEVAPSLNQTWGSILPAVMVVQQSCFSGSIAILAYVLASGHVIGVHVMYSM